MVPRPSSHCSRSAPRNNSPSCHQLHSHRGCMPPGSPSPRLASVQRDGRRSASHRRQRRRWSILRSSGASARRPLGSSAVHMECSLVARGILRLPRHSLLPPRDPHRQDQNWSIRSSVFIRAVHGVAACGSTASARSSSSRLRMCSVASSVGCRTDLYCLRTPPPLVILRAVRVWSALAHSVGSRSCQLAACVSRLYRSCLCCVECTAFIYTRGSRSIVPSYSLRHYHAARERTTLRVVWENYVVL